MPNRKKSTERMIAEIFKCFLQAFALNLISGFLFAFSLQYSRWQKFGLKSSSFFRVDTDLLALRANDVKESIDKRWLFLVCCKSILDIFVFSSFSKDGFMGGEMLLLLDGGVTKTSLMLSPINFLFAFFLIGSDNEVEIAAGLALGYHFGYLKVTGDHLYDIINESRYACELNKLPKRFILVPANGKLTNSLAMVDDRISFVENTASVKKDIGGTHERRYFQSVYQFTPREQDNFETFFCIIEQTASVQTIKDLERSGFFSRTSANKTIKIFHELLQKNVNSDKVTRDKFELVYFSGDDCDIVDVVVERRKALMAY